MSFKRNDCVEKKMVPHKVDDTISKVYVERGAEPNSVEKGNRIILLLLLEHFCLHLFSHFGSQPGHRTIG